MGITECLRCYHVNFAFLYKRTQVFYFFYISSNIPFYPWANFFLFPSLKAIIHLPLLSIPFTDTGINRYIIQLLSAYLILLALTYLLTYANKN